MDRDSTKWVWVGSNDDNWLKRVWLGSNEEDRLRYVLYICFLSLFITNDYNNGPQQHEMGLGGRRRRYWLKRVWLGRQ